MSRQLLMEYTTFVSTDILYIIAKRDGRWKRLFSYATLEEAERNDARLKAQIRRFRKNEPMNLIEISIIPYRGEDDYWMITDGFHRIVSAKFLGIGSLEVHVKKFGENVEALTELKRLLG